MDTTTADATPPGWWQPPSERGAARPAPGTPYHRLARTARHRWWRPLVGTLVLVAAWALGVMVIFAGTLVAVLVTGVDFAPADSGRLFGDPVVNIAVLLLMILAAIPAVALAAWGVQRRVPGSVSSVLGRVRWRWLAVCVGLAVPAIAVALGVLFLIPAPQAGSTMGDMDSGWVGARSFAIAAGVIVALVPLQSAAEEFVFRGWIIQAAGAYLRTPWFGIVVGAVLFAASHGFGSVWGFADIALYGLVAGWLTVRTGGLEATIALHTMNNMSAFLLAAAFGTLGGIQTAAQASWPLLAIDVVVLPAYALTAAYLATRMRVRRTVPDRPRDEPSQRPPEAFPGDAAH